MKKLLTITLILTTLVTAAQSPCKDSLYLALKAKPLDSLTQREFNYYMVKAEECKEAKVEQKQLQQTTSYLGIILLVTGVSTLIVLIPYISR
jgi:hypothetical protein